MEAGWSFLPAPVNAAFHEGHGDPPPAAPALSSCPYCGARPGSVTGGSSPFPASSSGPSACAGCATPSLSRRSCWSTAAPFLGRTCPRPHASSEGSWSKDRAAADLASGGTIGVLALPDRVVGVLIGVLVRGLAAERAGSRRVHYLHQSCGVRVSRGTLQAPQRPPAAGRRIRCLPARPLRVGPAPGRGPSRGHVGRSLPTV